MKFRGDVEGLRALAIVPVILHRADSHLMPGGYIGADLFFVISGFLITSIIMDDLDAGRFSFVAFYKKRIRRIIPPLFAMLAVTSIASICILSPAALEEFGLTLAATIAFASNLIFYKISGYFQAPAELKPLVHTWSLAVEEQFYIVFPWLLTTLHRYVRTKIFIVLTALCLASLILGAWLINASPSAAFYFGPARAFELLIGSMIALNRLPPLNALLRNIVATSGIAIVIACLFVFNDKTLFPGPIAIIPCIGTALVIYAGQHGTSSVYRFFEMTPVRYVGSISYSLYLWHWPTLALTRYYFQGEVPIEFTCAAVAMTVLLAVLSFHLIERPFKSIRLSGNSIFTRSGAAAIFGTTIAACLILSAGLPQRFGQPAQQMFYARSNFNPRMDVCHGSDNRRIPYPDNCMFGDPTARPTVAVFGDSHGPEIAFELGKFIGPHQSVMEVTASSCPPALGFSVRKPSECERRNEDAVDNLSSDKHIRLIVIVGRYASYDWPSVSRGIDKAVSRLSSSGKQIVIVYPTPEFRFSVPEALGFAVARGDKTSSVRISRVSFERDNKQVSEFLDEISEKYHARKIIPASLLCDLNYCFASDGTSPLYYDENHLSLAGASKVAHLIVDSTSMSRLAY